jgi:hypothetical protein
VLGQKLRKMQFLGNGKKIKIFFAEGVQGTTFILYFNPSPKYDATNNSTAVLDVSPDTTCDML